MAPRLAILLPVACSLAASALPATAFAQNIGYGAYGADDAADGEEGGSGAAARRGARGSYDPKRKFGVEVEPYIEVAQIVTKEFSPLDEVFTYSRAAVGADASINGRRTGGSLSARYERDFSWKNTRGDRERISGVANGYGTVAPGVKINVGGYADRARIDGDGAVSRAAFTEGDRLAQFYAVYAGPEVSAVMGDVVVNADYRIGYSAVDDSDTVIQAGEPREADFFQDSVTHNASFTAGIKPDTVLPIGIGVGGQYYREDISNLDQRIEDARAQVTASVNVAPDVSVSAAVGYEKVEISARDALRDAQGVPVIGSNGAYVTDKSSPRILAYDVDGLTWDAGVMYRPSRHASLAVHVGRKYGSTSVHGQLYYAPSDRHAFNVLVYDNVAGFGGQLTNAVAALPTDFLAVRNPLTGDLSGCVSSVGEGGCLDSALGSLRSTAFRARGIAGSYNLTLDKFRAGIAAGYDRRRFIAAPGTVLGLYNGQTDEHFWLNGNISYRFDARSELSTQAYAKWTKPEQSLYGDTVMLGATAAYYRALTRNLSATAAIGVDSQEREFLLEDYTTASALLGMRYSF